MLTFKVMNVMNIYYMYLFENKYYLLTTPMANIYVWNIGEKTIKFDENKFHKEPFPSCLLASRLAYKTENPSSIC